MTLVYEEPRTITRPIPLIPARTVVPAGDVRELHGSAVVLAEALRHAKALRLWDGSEIPGPTAIGIATSGAVEIVMPDVASVLAWQPLLTRPKLEYVNANDPHNLVMSGTREGRPWIVRTAAPHLSDRGNTGGNYNGGNGGNR
jgi:hypothetical protein